MKRQDLYCDRSHDIGLFLFLEELVSGRERKSMLTFLFSIWLLYATFKLGFFAIRAGWGIFKILLSMVFLPVAIIVLLIAGIIQLTVPVLVIIGVCTVINAIFGR